MCWAQVHYAGEHNDVEDVFGLEYISNKSISVLILYLCLE
jgi:hypothetical protein